MSNEPQKLYPPPISEVSLMDRMAFLAQFPDKYFDLAMDDPPYGIGQNWTKDRRSKHYLYRSNFNNSAPGKEYFDELIRVSKNQIIWGANYYWNFLPATNNLIYWRKGIDAKKQHMSAGELAYTSFTKYPLHEYFFWWCGFIKCEETIKIHPHQKPIKLYSQCFADYTTPGQRVVSCHVGSGSDRIAAYFAGLDFYGCELDGKHFAAQNERFNKAISEPLFTHAPPQQLSLI